MKRQNHSVQFNEQIINECRQIGNIALVARRHDLSPNTILSISGLKRLKKMAQLFFFQR